MRDISLLRQFFLFFVRFPPIYLAKRIVNISRAPTISPIVESFDNSDDIASITVRAGLSRIGGRASIPEGAQSHARL